MWTATFRQRRLPRRAAGHGVLSSNLKSEPGVSSRGLVTHGCVVSPSTWSHSQGARASCLSAFRVVPPRSHGIYRWPTYPLSGTPRRWLSVSEEASMSGTVNMAEVGDHGRDKKSQSAKDGNGAGPARNRNRNRTKFEYSRSIMKAVKQGKFDTVYAALEKLWAAGRAPSVSDFNLLIQTCVNKKDEIGALRIIALMEDEGVEFNKATFDPIFRLYKQTKDIDKAESLYQDLVVGQQLVPSIYAYNDLIHLYVEEGDVGKAMALLDEMKWRGYRPHVSNFRPILKQLCRNLDRKNAELLVKDMEKLNLTLDSECRISLMDLYAELGMISEVQHLFRNLIDDATEPKTDMDQANSGSTNVVSSSRGENFRQVVSKKDLSSAYSSLLVALAKNGEKERMWEVWQEMVNDDSLVPSAQSIIQLEEIQDRALLASVKLPYSGNVPRARPSDVSPSFNILGPKNIAVSHPSDSDLFDAVSMKQALRRDSLKGGKRACELLLDYFAHRGNAVEAKALVNEMEAKGLSPGTAAYGALMRAYVKAGEHKLAGELRYKLWTSSSIKDQERSKESLVTQRSGRHKKHPHGYSSRSLPNMSNASHPSWVLINTLIDLYGRGSRPDKVQEILKMVNVKTANSGVTSRMENVAHITALGKLYSANSKMGLISDQIEVESEFKPPIREEHPVNIARLDLNDAESVAEVVESLWSDYCSSRQPDIVLYGSVISAFGRLGFLRRAETLKDEMKMKGIEPNVIIYGSLLNMYRRAQLLDQSRGRRQAEGRSRSAAALQIWEEMTLSGVKPNTICLGFVIDILLADKQVDKAVGLLISCDQANLGLDAMAYSTVLQYLGEKKDVKRLRRLVNGLKGKGIRCTVSAKALRAVFDSHFGATGLRTPIEELGNMIDLLSSTAGNFESEAAAYAYLIHKATASRDMSKVEALRKLASKSAVNAQETDKERLSAVSDVAVVTSLVGSLSSCGSVVEALEVVEAAVEAGATVDPPLCHSLLHGVLKAEEKSLLYFVRRSNQFRDQKLNDEENERIGERAMQTIVSLVEKMRLTGVRPHPHFYASLLRLLELRMLKGELGKLSEMNNAHPQAMIQSIPKVEDDLCKLLRSLGEVRQDVNFIHGLIEAYTVPPMWMKLEEDGIVAGKDIFLNRVNRAVDLAQTLSKGEGGLNDLDGGVIVSLIGGLCRAGQTEVARELFDSLARKELSVDPRVGSHTRERTRVPASVIAATSSEHSLRALQHLLKAYGDQGDAKTAEMLFQEWFCIGSPETDSKETALRPTADTVGLRIRAHVRGEGTDEALRILRELERSSPDVIDALSYLPVLAALAKEGRVEAAEGVFNQFRSRLSTLIEAEKSGSRGVKRTRRRREAGYTSKIASIPAGSSRVPWEADIVSSPITACFNVAIRMLADCGRLSDAQDVLTELEAYSLDETGQHSGDMTLSPDVYSYNGLLAGFAKVGDVTRANAIFQKLSTNKNGCTPQSLDASTSTPISIDAVCADAHTYGSMIAAYCNANQFQNALQLLKGLCRNKDVGGPIPTPIMVKTLVQGFVNRFDTEGTQSYLDEAWSALEDLENEGLRIPFEAHSLVIPRILVAGDSTKLIELVHRVVEGDVNLDSAGLANLKHALESMNMTEELQKLEQIPK